MAAILPHERLVMRVCDACGMPEPERCFIEGYCATCHRERQDALDLHNAQFDWWESLTLAKRDVQIRNACRLAP